MTEYLIYIAVGFVAQLIDGALGMAFGVTATSLLLSVGIAPATAVCVIDRETGGTEALAVEGVTLHALLSMSRILSA